MATAGSLYQKILSNKMTTLNGIFTLGSMLYTYDESRNEGKGVVSSLMSSAFDGATSSLLGIKGALGIGLIANGPGLVYGAYKAYGQYARQLSASQRVQDFQNAQFNDTEQAYTMRQAGMAIAERSRYNTQQAMLGNEAKYMY